MARQSDSNLLDLVRLAYAAAVGTSGWRPFMERYAEVMTATGVSFMQHGREAGSTLALAAGPALTDAVRESYNAYYGVRNPIVKRASAWVKPGDIVLGHVVCPLGPFKRTEYYNDFIRSLDMGSVMGAWLLRTGTGYANLSCLRPLRTGVFDDSDREFVSRLVPHLQRALQMQQRLHGLRLDHRSDAAALDRVAAAIFVLSPDGRLLIANTKARLLLQARDGLLLAADGLRASHQAE
jgi:hypothetical protein